MRIAVYAGTFDPVTNGHLAIIAKALPLFDELHVLVAVNPTKTPWFSAQERSDLLRCSAPAAVMVASTQGYVVDYAKSVGAKWLVRGVRDGADATAELALASLNSQLAPDIATVFITANAAMFDLSSSKLKALVTRGEPVAALCPAVVATALVARAQRLAVVESHSENAVL